MACPHVREDRINGGMKGRLKKETNENTDKSRKERRILLVIGVMTLTLVMAVGVTMLFHLSNDHQHRKLRPHFCRSFVHML